LREALAQAPVLGQTTVEVRARGSQPARTAMVEIRSVRIDLKGPWRPGGWQPDLKGVNVVEVREVHAPEGVKEPLHWILLTSLACHTWAQGQRVVGRYGARWWVEEYHKALKSGAGVEESQLERGYRLEALIAVLAVVAVRLLSTKMLARSRPEGIEAAASFGPEMLELAGELADGVVLWMSSPTYIRDRIVPALTAARTKAGKSMEGFEIVAAIPVCLTTDRESGLAVFRQTVTRYASLPYYRKILDASGFKDQLEADEISDAMLDELAGIGDEQRVRNAIERYRQAGVTVLGVGPFGGHEGARGFEATLEAVATAFI